jgi:hypothetical protein
LILRVVPASDRSVASIWQEIERRLGNEGLTCSWAWTGTWLKHYGDAIPHTFVVAESDGPRGIALVTHGIGKRRGPFPVRTLHIGTAGEPDAETVRVQYNRLLVSDTDRPDFLSGLVELLAESGIAFDELRLDGFPESEIAPLVRQSDAFVLDRRTCHVADLIAVRQKGLQFKDAVRGDMGKKLRRSVRRIEEELGPIQVEWAESLEQARTTFAEMVALHEARWRADGKPGAFASPRFAGFHRDLIQELFPQGKILLARVRAGDVTIGCDYSFIERNRVLGYQWGVARLDDERLSPGVATGAAMLQAALERGLDEYDWLSGDTFYKRQLSTTTRELIWARSSRGARIQMIYKLHEASRLARQFGARRAQSAVSSA